MYLGNKIFFFSAFQFFPHLENSFLALISTRKSKKKLRDFLKVLLLFKKKKKKNGFTLINSIVKQSLKQIQSKDFASIYSILQKGLETEQI